MEHDHIHKHEERVTSTYAEIYFDDDYCGVRKPLQIEFEDTEPSEDEDVGDEWVSPSDQLIGIVDLIPPFTSKITRGKTHEGILAIGNDVLENERARFLKTLTQLLNDNDQGWSHILQNERKLVEQKVKRIYDNIFATKSKIMSKEISEFYEKTLQELEDHLRSELKDLLLSARANIISDLNIEIKEKLAKERTIVEEVLQNRYQNETSKIKKYYKLLLENELQRSSKLINQALKERNDALNSFYRQIEAENITSTMYVMCTERKKCKIKQFLLENYQTTDIAEKMHKIKERQKILDEYKRQEVHITQINRDWEEKIKKVLQLFLKFISYSLKLLPEQTTFLLDLEKMVVLQMNEIQKHPQKCSSILMDDVAFQNIFKFEEKIPKPMVCEGEPFVIVGDLNDPTPPRYGSRETLPSDVDLPFVRVDRQFFYAKCHDFEEVKVFLETQRCKCQDIPSKTPSNVSTLSGIPVTAPPSPSTATESSVSLDEPLLIDDIHRLHHCPARSCQNWAERMSFPYLNAYLDFTEENFQRVTTILDHPMQLPIPPELLDPRKYVNAELPFSATKELYHNAETQYSSQEELYVPEVGCTCFDTNTRTVGKQQSSSEMKESPSKELNDILQRRKTSIRNLIQEHPNLLKIFTDECFDFQL
ncbi:uncharacterized protein LOC114365103 [Ostrinia furnacalis]|uniref:uncharacterized protein LOC114365103 n=1 Tax=Ostrinia furnacalis TaxID=93504 RepID=UPI00103D626D|nr:uncharacterized protein LOC114365103 [Ostrinia furnacalis]